MPKPNNEDEASCRQGIWRGWMEVQAKQHLVQPLKQQCFGPQDLKSKQGQPNKGHLKANAA